MGLKCFSWIEKIGEVLVEGLHLFGLFVVGATVIWSAVHEYLVIMQQSHATLDNILLLFIYLELGAMIGIYFRTHRLPVQFLLYIAITALARYLTIDLKQLDVTVILSLTVAILLLTVAIWVIRYGQATYTSHEDEH